MAELPKPLPLWLLQVVVFLFVLVLVAAPAMSGLGTIMHNVSAALANVSE